MRLVEIGPMRLVEIGPMRLSWNRSVKVGPLRWVSCRTPLPAHANAAAAGGGARCSDAPGGEGPRRLTTPSQPLVASQPASVAQARLHSARSCRPASAVPPRAGARLKAAAAAASGGKGPATVGGGDGAGAVMGREAGRAGGASWIFRQGPLDAAELQRAAVSC